MRPTHDDSGDSGNDHDAGWMRVRCRMMHDTYQYDRDHDHDGASQVRANGIRFIMTLMIMIMLMLLRIKCASDARRFVMAICL